MSFKKEFEKILGRKIDNKSVSEPTGFRYIRKVHYDNHCSYRYLKNKKRIERKNLLDLKREMWIQRLDWVVEDLDLAIDTVKNEDIKFNNIFF